MYHGHLECGDFLCTCLRFTHIRWEVVVDEELVKHLAVNTIDTTDTLNDTCGIVWNVIVEDSTSTVQVVTFRDGIGGHKYLIVVALKFFLQSGIKVGAYALFIIGRCIGRSVFHYRKTCLQQFLTEIIDGVGILREDYKLTLRLLLQFFLRYSDK